MINKLIKVNMAILLLVIVGCTKPEETKTACEQLDEIDLEMLNLIDQINKLYQDDKSFLKAFKDSQIYWIQYRNRQVKAVYPLSPRKYDFDVGECKCEVYRDLTKIRVKELKKWIEGMPESQCQGSIPIKTK